MSCNSFKLAQTQGQTVFQVDVVKGKKYCMAPTFNLPKLPVMDCVSQNSYAEVPTPSG